MLLDSLRTFQEGGSDGFCLVLIRLGHGSITFFITACSASGSMGIRTPVYARACEFFAAIRYPRSARSSAGHGPACANALARRAHT